MHDVMSHSHSGRDVHSRFKTSVVFVNSRKHKPISYHTYSYLLTNKICLAQSLTN